MTCMARTFSLLIIPSIPSSLQRITKAYYRQIHCRFFFAGPLREDLHLVVLTARAGFVLSEDFPQGRRSSACLGLGFNLFSPHSCLCTYHPRASLRKSHSWRRSCKTARRAPTQHRRCATNALHFAFDFPHSVRLRAHNFRRVSVFVRYQLSKQHHRCDVSFAPPSRTLCARARTQFRQVFADHSCSL